MSPVTAASCFLLGIILIVGDIRFSSAAQKTTTEVTGSTTTVTVTAVPGNTSDVEESITEEEDADDDGVVTADDAVESDEADDVGEVSAAKEEADVELLDVGSNETATVEDTSEHSPETTAAAAAAAADDNDESLTSSIWSHNPPVDFAALKADHDLMHSLTDYLGRFGIKMPTSLINRVDKTDLCAENSIGGLQCKHRVCNIKFEI